MMLVAISWNSVLRGSVFGPSCSCLDFSLNGVKLGCWYFMELVYLVMYYIIKTYVMYGLWMLCWSGDVLWLRDLCHLSFFLVDQVLVLDYWCRNSFCFHE